MENDDKPMFLQDALDILGWQGGTIHQVLTVLRCAKLVSDSYESAHVTNEWDELKAHLLSLNKSVRGY